MSEIERYVEVRRQSAMLELFILEASGWKRLLACGQVVVESDSDAARATASVMVDVTMGAIEKAYDCDACGYRGTCIVKEAIIRSCV